MPQGFKKRESVWDAIKMGEEMRRLRRATGMQSIEISCITTLFSSQRERLL
jgi:hypothetical protein